MFAPLQTLSGGFCVLIWKTLPASLLLRDEFFLDYYFAHIAQNSRNDKLLVK